MAAPKELKIAFLILPATGNNGENLDQVHNILQANLLDRFGGFTQIAVSGAWKDQDGTVYREPGYKYEVAMTTGFVDGKDFVHIAGMACLAARQVCVMVQIASGLVKFVDGAGRMV